MSDWSSDHYTKLRISGTNWNRTYSYNFYKNTWYHIVVCDDGTHTYAYVNGNLIGDTAASFLPTSIEGSDICIGGATYYSGMQFFGKINDVRIYDYCLSAAEVKELSQGLVLHYKLDGGATGNPNLLPNSKLNGSWTYPSSSYSDKYSAATTIVPTGTQYVLSFDAKSTVNGDKMRTHYYNPNTTTTCVSSQGITKTASDGNMDFTLSTNWERYWVIYTQTDTTAAKRVICPRLVSGQGTGTVSVKNIKLEEGTVATGWRAAEETDTIIEDSSGYGHHGSITGNIVSNSNTPRYLASSSFNGTERIVTDSPGADIRTLSCWCKTTKNKSTSQHMVADSFSNMCISFYNGTIIGVFGTTRSTGSKSTLGTSYKENDWNHIVVVKTDDAGARDIYCNGVKLTPTTNDYWGAAAGFYVGARNTANNNAFYGQISDVRAYVTPLDADAIRQLYEVGAKIDKQANFHTFEISENDTNRLTKTGIMHDNMEESIMTLPDGSCWQLLLFHYVDNGNNLFTSSNATNCNDFGLFSRLKDINNFKIGTQYEFYGLQDGNAYRWIQTNAPMTTTAVTGFSAVSGYTSPGAGICKCNGNTVLARTGTTSNWWNAVGCYTKYNGGIPGYAQTICKKYMALYARIEKADVKISNQTLNASEIIEL